MFTGRLPNSTLREDTARWPSTLKALSEEIHAQGLLFGSYTSASEFTCQWRQGSFGHEKEDARNFCEQGLDFLWIDDCNGLKWPKVKSSWARFRQFSDECVAGGGRPMVMHLSSCNPTLNATGENAGCMDWIGTMGVSAAALFRVFFRSSKKQLLRRMPGGRLETSRGRWNPCCRTLTTTMRWRRWPSRATGTTLTCERSDSGNSLTATF